MATLNFSRPAPGVIRLWQDVFPVPQTTLLSFDYRAGWDMTGATLDRTFRVALEPAGGGAELRSYSILRAPAGDADADSGNRSIALGLDAHAGSAVRIVFEWTVPEAVGSALFQLDDVRLDCVTCCPGDADNSGGSVNAQDFLTVQGSFGLDNGTGGLGDANCSGGAVNASDFLAVQANFGLSCG